jgi:putative ABC transport system permease protein
MNIMLVTVSERTRDIGIRLALGAGRRDILVQFLLEASILSFAGGLIGLAIGVGLPLWAGLVYDVDVPISAASVLVAFCVSMLVGVFFGFYPARKAADMNLVDSLGYE